MIFDDIDIFEKMSGEEKVKHFGDVKELPPISNSQRSNMMLNPLKLKHLNRLDSLECDVVTLNLEDAIAPSRKEEALVNIALALSNLKSRNSKIVVRVNPLDAGGEDEIKFLSQFVFDAVRLPKVRTIDEIKEALEILPESKELHLSIETKEAFRDLAWWGVEERVTTVNLGILDLLADLKLPQSLLKIGNPTISYILSKFLTDARITGFLPVSFMYQEYKNLDEFTRWLEIEREMGFTSKACMGPAQVEIVNRVLGVDEVAIKRAKEIKRAFEESSQKGINGFMHPEYGFIDEPIYRDALNVLGG